MKRETLLPLTVKELRALAAKKGIPKASSLVKTELIEALASSSKNPAPTAKIIAPTTEAKATIKNSATAKKISATKKSATKNNSSAKTKSKKHYLVIYFII